MFDWFWNFLYMISKTLFRLTDGLILCANKLCGIEPISFNGEDTDLMSYLLFSDEIGFAFKATAILGTILVVIFTVFMIIRNITREKADGTPAQLSVKAFKTILTFFFVPAVILAFVMIGNIFVTAIYNATIQASSTPGTFLFCAFAEDGGMPAELVERFRNGMYDYINTDEVWACMDLSEFPFLFSWIAGGVVLFSIGSSMLIFVDRVLSLVILYIVSPISISSSVLDDGARFKLWRDQFLSKFIMGYGMIIAVNIYALVCTLVMDPDFAFFEDSGFLNLLMKLLMIAGGALTMQKSMALIGNLVAAGAGSNELRDNAFTAGKLASMAGGVLGNTVGLLPKMSYKAGKSIISDALAMKSRDIGAQLLDKMGLGLSGGTSDQNGVKDPPGKSGAKNDEKAKYGSNPNATKDAIENKGFKMSFNSENANNNKSGSKKNDMLGNAINGGSQKGQDGQRGGDK